MFTFWLRWLQAGMILFVVFGISFALLGTTGLFSPYVAPVVSAFWPGGEIPAESRDFAILCFGIMGALSAAFGELGWFVARYAVARRERWALAALLLSLVLWYVLDGAVSFYAGASLNVVFNTVFFIVVLVPLIGLWSHMDSKTAHGQPTATTA